MSSSIRLKLDIHDHSTPFQLSTHPLGGSFTGRAGQTQTHHLRALRFPRALTPAPAFKIKSHSYGISRENLTPPSPRFCNGLHFGFMVHQSKWISREVENTNFRPQHSDSHRIFALIADVWSSATEFEWCGVIVNV
ncbi:hypothetical protein AVEN_127909-1 [Araneus ventricosus]|uniref:Uncharacterized protein n=1 Tax=Araneus ventricosus TaxID=182803 RepID=A0A4Y1ZZW9_ARAVE|nr:hypothetical protein AVEN_127909-1 [Araneus ventricosus]